MFRHVFAHALAYLRLGAIPAYFVANLGIRRVFRVTAFSCKESLARRTCRMRWDVAFEGAVTLPLRDARPQRDAARAPLRHSDRVVDEHESKEGQLARGCRLER